MNWIESRAEPAQVLGAGWADRLREEYSPEGRNEPLEQVIAVAALHGVQAVLVERRYVDPDYRSEHSRFYAGTFREHRSVCDRLHFFTQEVDDGLDLSDLQPSYVGYSVMRPASANPVGRTMLTPPPELDSGSVCVATERVHPFGFTLSVTAMPFISQDEQYLRCAHAAQWMVLYHAYLAHRMPRRLPEDIHDAARNGKVIGRQVPSEGLSPSQMLSSLQAMQMSAGMIELPGKDRQRSRNRRNTSLFALLCRYINSDMPPIVISKSHAWVVVAYRQEGERHHDDTVLYGHDDAKGPYIQVDPWDEDLQHHEKWWLAIPPLPQRVYLSAERAEPIGVFWFKNGPERILSRFDDTGPQDLFDQPVDSERIEEQRRRISDLRAAIERGEVAFRTYALRSHRFKSQTAGRLPQNIARLYRGSHLPGYVWIVEALDRTRTDSRECVLGEAIIDPTSNHTGKADESSRPALLALNIVGMTFSVHPDIEGETTVEFAETFEPYASGCPGWRWREAPYDD